MLVETTRLVRSAKRDGIARSRHLVCVRSSRRTAERVSCDKVTSSAAEAVRDCIPQSLVDKRNPRYYSGGLVIVVETTRLELVTSTMST